jgi:hypothetical protein
VRKTPGWIACFSLLALIGAMAVACTPKSHQEQVTEMRAKYAADLNGFVLKSEPAATAEPAPPPAAAPGGEDEDGGGADATAATGPAGPLDDTIEELPVTSDVVLDILITNKNDDKLPGLTIDVSQVDAAKQEKGHWRIWVDTSQVGRGSGTQVSHVLEGVDYEEGDGFQVEVRGAVPAADQGEYREFAATP